MTADLTGRATRVLYALCTQDLQGKLGDSQQLCARQEADIQALSTSLSEKQQGLVDLEAVRNTGRQWFDHRSPCGRTPALIRRVYDLQTSPVMMQCWSGRRGAAPTAKGGDECSGGGLPGEGAGGAGAGAAQGGGGGKGREAGYEEGVWLYYWEVAQWVDVSTVHSASRSSGSSVLPWISTCTEGPDAYLCAGGGAEFGAAAEDR